MIRRALVVALLVAAPIVARAAEHERNIDPRADRLLHQMSDYVSGMKSFKVQSTANDQKVLKSGQKIDSFHTSVITVKRPNGLRSDRLGAPDSFFWDGHKYTMACAPEGPFATAPAPPQMDEALDRARVRYKLDPPGADVLFSDPYTVMTKDAVAGKYLGVEYIDGQKTQHLAFPGKEVDIQIWILDGPKPLPVRYTIVSKTERSQPQSTVQLNHWQPEAVITDNDFRYAPGTGAHSTASFPLVCTPAG